MTASMAPVFDARHLPHEGVAERFGRTVRRLRQARGWSQEWVAEQVNAYHQDRQAERDRRLLDKTRHFDR